MLEGLDSWTTIRVGLIRPRFGWCNQKEESQDGPLR
jgi:hypothetical protein